jgi:hypothetical protein
MYSRRPHLVLAAGSCQRAFDPRVSVFIENLMRVNISFQARICRMTNGIFMTAAIQCDAKVEVVSAEPILGSAPRYSKEILLATSLGGEVAPALRSHRFVSN